MNKFALLFCTLTIFLTACPAADTGGPNPPSNREVTQLGIILLNDFSAPGYPASTNAITSFNSIDAIQTGDLPDNPVQPHLDTCFVTQNPDDIPPFLNPAPAVTLGRPLDAGETITIRSGNTALTTLKREGQGEGMFYLQDGAEIAPGIPEGELTADIPGGDFPGYSAARFPNVPTVALTAPQQPTGITPETVFSWQAFTSAETNSAVMLQALQIDESNPGAFTGVMCMATDDGSFTFPESTRAELSEAGFTEGVLLAVSRIASRLEIKENSALYLQLLRQTGLGTPGF